MSKKRRFTASTAPAPASRQAFDRAVACMRVGDAATAEKVCRNALMQQGSNDANLYSLLGAALLQLGRAAEAEAALSRAIVLAPGFAGAYEGRAEARMAQNRLSECLSDLEHARSLAPDKISILWKLARVQIGLGNDPAAVDLLRRVNSANPQDLKVLLLLAGALSRQKRWDEAEAVLQQAVACHPESQQSWMELGLIQQRRDQLAAAEHSFRRAGDLDPHSAPARVALGTVLTLAGRHLEALDAFRAAHERDGSNGDALAGMGHVLKTLGDPSGAIDAYRRCIAAHPDDGQAYWALADFKNFRFEDRDIAAMREQIASPNLTATQRIGLLFALGTALDQRHEYTTAFGCFETGNRLRRQFENYDGDRVARLHEELRTLFTPEFIAQRAGSGHPDEAPIFIVGMPRSGSTLVEQILASHSQVDGTYELPELGQIARSTGTRRPESPPYPASVAQLSTADLAALGARYLELTRAYRGTRPRFTDKMPNNFVHAGFIALILPNARIINVRRHPLDACLSCYMQLFAHGQSFSYDLQELGRHYVEYQRLMEHWHAVLPGRILDLQYEDLVLDLPGQVRRLLDYCGLRWEEGCLQYHQNERIVRSASSEQVRMPLYQKSLNRWHNYHSHLQPLIAALGSLAACRT